MRNLKDRAFYRHKGTGEVGQLEITPLHDPSGAPVDASILWIPSRGELADHYLYVSDDQIEPIGGDEEGAYAM